MRDLRNSRFPDIKGLSVKSFKKQLGYLRERYTFVTVDQCIKQLNAPDEHFPKDAALLTFDDGYKEHFTEVFPLLDSLGIQGAFFPPVQAIVEHKVLDVNKIHFVLASAGEPRDLVKAVNKQIVDLANEHNLNDLEFYQNKLSDVNHRYDPPEVIYVKRLLQRELPEIPRKIILDQLFMEYVGVNEEVFAKELYMNTDQIHCMLRHGMFVGGHGYSHKWLNAMDAEEQEFEVDKTKEFLATLGVSTDEWVMCYPYGAYNENLIEILKEKDSAMGLATEVGVAELTQENAFMLNRMDTNDFPKKNLVDK